MSGATKAPSQGSVPVLMYHSISDGSGPTRIAPEVFQRQMAILEESGYQVVSLLELGEWIRGLRDLPPRSTVLTFDDGFLDFATTAFPELKRRRWPVTVFLPVGHVGGTDRWERASPRRDRAVDGLGDGRGAGGGRGGFRRPRGDTPRSHPD